MQNDLMKESSCKIKINETKRAPNPVTKVYSCNQIVRQHAPPTNND